MDVKHQAEIQDVVFLDTKEHLELPKPKPSRSTLFKKFLLGISVVLASLFVVYIGLLNKFQQRTYYVRNFPSFGFGKCEPHLYYRSLQSFEFDPKEFDRFSFYGYNDHKGSSIKFAKHSDSSNVKILYNIHASDQYTLDNIKTYSTSGYGYQFHVDSPYSSFFKRHCIKVQLTISFPEGLESFNEVSLGGNMNHLNVTADLDTKFNNLYFHSQDGIYVKSLKANHLSASSSGFVQVSDVQMNGGYISSYYNTVIVYKVEKFENKSANNTISYGSGIQVNGRGFTLVEEVHARDITVRSDVSVVKSVKVESLTIQANSDVRVFDSSVNYLDVNTLSEVSATVSDSNQVSIYTKNGPAHVTVKSLGKLNQTSPRKSHPSHSRYYSGYRPSVHRNYYSFEVLSLNGDSSIGLPYTYEGRFEAIARIGQANVNSTTDTSKIHFSESKASFKNGYYGANKNSANKAKVETGGRYTSAKVHFE